MLQARGYCPKKISLTAVSTSIARGERLAHLLVGEDAVLLVQEQRVGQTRVGDRFDGVVGGHLLDEVRREVRHDVGLATRQGTDAHRGLGQDVDPQRPERRRAGAVGAPGVVIVAGIHDVLVGSVFGQLEGARPDRDVGSAGGELIGLGLEHRRRVEAEQSRARGLQERGVGLAEAHAHGVLVDDVGAGVEIAAEHARGLRRGRLGVDDAIEVGLHRGGVEGGAVVEGHIGAQAEEVARAAVLDVPRLGQPRRERPVGLLEHQRVEHGALHHRGDVELAGLRVHLAGREVGALDRPDDLPAILGGRVGTGARRERESGDRGDGDRREHATGKR